MNISKTYHACLALTFFFAMAGVGSAALHAEDAASGDEAKEAADEDENEKNLSEIEKINAIKTVTGKLIFGGDDGSGVVGSLIESNTKSYSLKVSKPELLKDLASFNNQTVSLQGKLRNKGKYFVIISVSLPLGGGASPDRKKRGGI